MPRTPTLRYSLLAATALALPGCAPIERALDTTTPHERYAESLEAAGLADRGLGREWLGASRRALEEALPVALPFRETGYFPPDEASAAGFRFDGRRGQQVFIEVEAQADGELALFLDLFEPSTDSIGAFERLESADSGTTRLDVELERDGPYLIRLQPELLRSGRYTLTVRAAPTLAFPVEGRDSRAILSRFGVERDGGRRQHHGVDIFAPRGTPALAAVDGIVRRVGVNRLGGNVVWLWDEARNQSLYYAHLDTQLVAGGTRVRPGDTLGLIGNTGNARTTPPHLHFGIYHRGEGPIDPWPFVHQPTDEPPPALADSMPLGHLARVTSRRAVLRSDASVRADSLGATPPRTLVRVAAGNADGWRRVRLPDGRQGFLRASQLESADAPVVSRRVTETQPLLEAPAMGAVLIDSIAPGTMIAELGRFADYAYVRPDGGRTGWISLQVYAASR